MMGGKKEYVLSFVDRATKQTANVGLPSSGVTYDDFQTADAEARLWSAARRDLTVYLRECQVGKAPRDISRYRDGRMG